MSQNAAFNHVGHCVADLARSRRFYEELLGFELDRVLHVPDAPTSKLLRIPPPVGLTAVYLRLDGFVLELMEFRREGNPGFRERVVNEPGLTHISVSVPDVAAVVGQVASFGGTVLEDTDLGGMAVFIRDPDGQLIELLPSGWR